MPPVFFLKFPLFQRLLLGVLVGGCSTWRRLIEWARVVFPVQVALALTYAAMRRELLLLLPLRLHLPSLEARLGRSFVHHVILATTPRSLSFAFAVANVFITHGYAGASVVLTPVCGFFLVLQLSHAGRASSWQALHPLTERREDEGCASRRGRADHHEVRQMRDKVMVWVTCLSTLVVCNLVEPPTRMNLGSRRPNLANGLLGLTSFNHWKALRYSVRTEEKEAAARFLCFFASFSSFLLNALAEPSFTLKKKKTSLSTGTASTHTSHYERIARLCLLLQACSDATAW